MTPAVLAGVLGALLVVSEAVEAAGQSASSSPGAVSSTVSKALVVPPASRPPARSKDLFLTQGEPAAKAVVMWLYRFGRSVPEVRVDGSDLPPACALPGRPAPPIDPGIFMPPRDTHINFMIRRIVPKGCIDPGILGHGRR